MKHKKTCIIIGIMVIILVGYLLYLALQKPEIGNALLFPENQTHHFETLRALGYATSGGADINEILHTISDIEAGDPESWYQGWVSLADRVKSEGDRYTNDQMGRGNALLKASNYYRTAEFMLYPDDPRKNETYHKSMDSFYGGLDALTVSYEQIEIPYQGSHLDGIFFSGDLSQHGDTLILIINGYDSIKEETYFVLGKAALERGFSFMSYDGPGQGSAIRERNLYLTHEWEAVNRAVLDVVLAEHPEIQEVVLVGFSVGSILATKAAADDARITMLVQYDIMYDFSRTAREEMPPVFQEQVFTDGPRPDWVSRSLEMTMKFSSEQDWALRHGAWIMGLDDYAEVLNRYRKFEISQDAPQVRVPVLLLTGENDHFVSEEVISQTEAAFSQAQSVTSIFYDSQSGGDEHCQAGAMSLWNADFFEWVFSNH